MSMDEMQNWTNYLEVMRNRLLIVNDADSLISVLTDIKNIPIALSTIEDVTDGTGLNMSLSVICSEVKVVGSSRISSYSYYRTSGSRQDHDSKTNTNYTAGTYDGGKP